MDHQEILDRLKEAIIAGDTASVVEAAEDSLRAGIAPLTAVEDGLSKGMGIVGDRFETGEAFLPELLMAGDSFKASMTVLKPALEKEKTQIKSRGKMVLASVKGDVHDLGKDIVKTMMEINGFEILDLGVDIASLTIIEEARKSGAELIGLSAIMTTTMQYQREVVEMLRDMGLRDRFKVLVGGGPVNQAWAEEIGADGFGSTATAAVEVSARLLEK